MKLKCLFVRKGMNNGIFVCLYPIIVVLTLLLLLLLLRTKHGHNQLDDDGNNWPISSIIALFIRETFCQKIIHFFLIIKLH